MRFLIAAILIAAATGQASAACSCLCVDGKVAARCTLRSEIAPGCPASTCRKAASSAATAPLGAAPYAPAEITTTVPPSITNPDSASPAPFPASPIAPRARIDAPADPIAGDTPRTPQAQSIDNPTGPLSITRPDIPTTLAPNDSSLCYQRQVFNPNTYEYEWQEACD
jgi:hypothetical protein